MKGPPLNLPQWEITAVCSVRGVSTAPMGAAAPISTWSSGKLGSGGVWEAGRGVRPQLSPSICLSIHLSIRPGPGSPTAPLKELAQRVRRQQQALELCVQELRRLCLREAVSLGTGGTPPTPPHLQSPLSVPTPVPRS